MANVGEKRKRGQSPPQDSVRCHNVEVREHIWQYEFKQDWRDFEKLQSVFLNDAYLHWKNTMGPVEVEIAHEPRRIVNFLTFKQTSYTRRTPSGYERKVRKITQWALPPSRAADKLRCVAILAKTSRNTMRCVSGHSPFLNACFGYWFNYVYNNSMHIFKKYSCDLNWDGSMFRLLSLLFFCRSAMFHCSNSRAAKKTSTQTPTFIPARATAKGTGVR
jgi:hypothetical protein